MALPGQTSIELPLLLELERNGGRVTRGPAFSTFFDAVARHFPGVTSLDRQLKRADGRTPAWDNSIAWCRNTLKEKGQISAAQQGVWAITESGRRRVREELQVLGVAPHEVESFIPSSMTLPMKVGARWNPIARRLPRKQVSRSGAVAPGPDRGETPPPAPPSRSPESVTAVPENLDKSLLSRILALKAEEFERLVGRLLQTLGMQVRVTGRSHDGGIDGLAEIPLLGVKVALQAKKWSSQSVGIDVVQRLIGSVVSDKCAAGVLITTSSFTAGAKELAERPDSVLSLIDGTALVKLLAERGLGIKSVPLVTQQLDEEFFSI